MTGDLVELELPRLHRRPDLVIDAGDGTATVWAPQTPRAGVWDVVVTRDGGEPVEVVFARPPSGRAWYRCADHGRASHRHGCACVTAATRAADLFLTRTEKG